MTKKSVLLFLYCCLYLTILLLCLAGSRGLSIVSLIICSNSILAISVIIFDLKRNNNLLSLGIVFNIFGWFYSNYYFIQALIFKRTVSITESALLIFSSIAVVCFNASYYAVYDFIMGNKNKYKSRISISKTYNWNNILIMIWCVFLLGLLTEYYVLCSKIGLSEFFHSTRSAKSLMLSRYSILSFYKDFITLSMIVSLYMYLKRKIPSSLLLFFLSFSMALFNAFVSASRAEILFIILPIIVLLRCFNKISNRTIIIIGIIGIGLFAVWKGILNSIMNGKTLDLQVVLKSASLDSEFNTWVKVGNNILNDTDRSGGWLWGESYIKTAYNLISPVTNVEPLSRWYLKRYEYNVLVSGGGRGFSGPLEAYMNFGILGIGIIYTLYGLFFRRLSIVSNRDEKYKIIMIIFMVSTYKLFRAESYSFWKTMYWFSLIPCICMFRLTRTIRKETIHPVK